MAILSLTKNDAAKLLGITPRTLLSWEKAGRGVPRNEDGTYSGPALFRWALSEVAGEGDDRLDAEQERARKDAEMADKLALENARTRRLVVRTSEVVRFVAAHNANARARLLRMPSVLAPRLAGVTEATVIAETIRGVLYEALSELADWEWDPDDEGADSVSASERA